MRFYSFVTEKGTYRCRLDAEASCQLEDDLGENPAVFMLKNATGGAPKLKPCMKIFHASLQRFHKGISYEDACGIYDEYIEGGKGMFDFIGEIINILHDSGLLRPVDQQEDTKEKN